MIVFCCFFLRVYADSGLWPILHVYTEIWCSAVGTAPALRTGYTTFYVLTQYSRNWHTYHCINSISAMICANSCYCATPVYMVQNSNLLILHAVLLNGPIKLFITPTLFRVAQAHIRKGWAVVYPIWRLAQLDCSNRQSLPWGGFGSARVRMYLFIYFYVVLLFPIGCFSCFLGLRIDGVWAHCNSFDIWHHPNDEITSQLITSIFQICLTHQKASNRQVSGHTSFHLFTFPALCSHFY